MTIPLFLPSDFENLDLSDRSARAKRKRGAVGDEFLGSPPVSNTGVKEPCITPIEIVSLPDNLFDLQGSAGLTNRFWRAPVCPGEKWEMIYHELTPLETANPNSAGVDWLHIVFKMRCNQSNIDGVDRTLRQSFGFGLGSEKGYGRFNYARQFGLEDGKSLFMIGGEFQKDTAMIAIPGSALQYLDLDKVRDLGEKKLKGWITRVDLCADFYNGEYTVDNAVGDYKAGLYNCGGRTPSHRYIGPLEVLHGSDGRTFYIGRRENGKLLRIYEKGKKQGMYDGALSRWTRVELELHGSNPDARNKRVIPWDVLARPGAFLAGSCKALEFLSDTHDRIKSIALKTATSMKKAIDHARKVFGKVVNALCDMGMNAFSIVSLLKRDGFPSYYEKNKFESIGIASEEMREWCLKTFGCEQDYLLLPELL